MSQIPIELDRTRVGEMLRELKPLRGIGARVDWVSRQWVGSPYLECPLGGAADKDEVFSAALAGFDCVTYIESVLALAAADSVGEFADNLRLIRYRDGVVSWATRNHYMTAWIRENERAGFVRNRTRGRGLVRRDRRLDVVDGIPVQDVRVASIRKDDFVQRDRDVATGDLIFFASARRNLDVFHCGILIRVRGTVRMRHAARSRGRVVEEPVTDFLARNRMAGVILVRPEETFSRAA